MKPHNPILLLSRLYALVALLVWWCAMLLLGLDPMDLQPESENET